MADHFRVLIVGGSVAGLSFAHCLERLGISYTILEKGDKIAPQLGASIGILPNGGRILDQLGLFDAVEKEIDPLEVAKIRYPNGFGFGSQYPRTLHSAFGYPVSFLERRRFIQILYDKLKSKACVHVKKEVVSITNSQSGAVVRTADGSVYEADLVVGADGVHSVVRSEIWRCFTSASHLPTVTGRSTDGIKYEYSCIYGISMDVPNVRLGVQLSLLDDGMSLHVFTGKDGKLFWFLIFKNLYDGSFSNQNRSVDSARSICEGLQSRKVSDDLSWKEIWSRCTIWKMTPLEEGVFRQWNYGRLVCIGDAVRKMAPNIGQGANMAIEDAAKLASLLHGRFPLGGLSISEIDSILHEFVAARKPRSASMCSQSEFLVRMQANQGWGRRLLGRYLIPLLKDGPSSFSGLSISGAEKLDFLDLPTRSLKGPWDTSWLSVVQSGVSLRPRIGQYQYAACFAVAFFVLFLAKLR
ncbi:FAD dependent monooxygenase [Nemania abortiva]|nr:FAD dependent monooxygenase [Nemania abortiva]